MSAETGHADTPYILIVEDDEDSLEAMTQLLTYEGYSNVGVHNGAEALDYLSKHPVPRLIFLDLVMPVMSGREFRDHQLRHPRWSQIPTVAFTATHDARKGDLDGIKEFIPKPVALETIINLVETYCAEK